MATDYSQGDYRVVAKRLLPAAQELVASRRAAAGDVLVDVAAGTGNVARLGTARGARAVATDLSTAQLRLGREDADPYISWVAGEAVALPLRDGVADSALDLRPGRSCRRYQYGEHGDGFVLRDRYLVATARVR